MWLVFQNLISCLLAKYLFQITCRNFEIGKMYCSDEHLKEKEKNCEYPPRFRIKCKQIDESDSLSGFVLSKRLKNKEIKCIVAFPLDKNATGEKLVCSVMYTVNGERFTGLNFRVFHGFL